MAFSANSNQKFCATCAHWSGPRTINSSRDRVNCDGNYTPEGKCYLDQRVGGFVNGPSANWCCPKHSKWSALK